MSLRSYSVVGVTGLPLAFLVLAFPVVFVQIKAALLFIFVGGLMLTVASNGFSNVRMPVGVFYFFAGMFLLNGSYILLGVVHGAPTEAMLESVFVYLLYPLFYFFAILLVADQLSIRVVTYFLIALGIFISLLTIMQAARVFGFGSVPGYSLLYYIYPDLVYHHREFAFTGENGYLPRAAERFVFLAPFAVGLLLAGSRIGISRALIVLNLLLVSAATVLTERRAFLLILVLILSISLTRWALTRIGQVAAVILIAAVAGVVLILADVGLSLGPMNFSNNLSEAGSRVQESYTSADLGTRELQVEMLVRSAGDRPIFGHGYGSSIASFYRNTQAPWRFEMTYVALLFQAGALGLALYAALALQLGIVARNAYKADPTYVLPFIFGLAGAMLAVTTNPYLNYGTGQWLLFLPVAVFCTVLLKTKQGVLEAK